MMDDTAETLVQHSVHSSIQDAKHAIMAQRDGRSEQEGGIRVRIKEEEIPIEINTAAVPMTPRNVKIEEEETHVRVKDEEVPVEIDAGGFSNVDAQRVPLHPGGRMKTEDGLSKEVQDGKQMKVEVKEEVEDVKVRSDKPCKQEDVSIEIGSDGMYTSYDVIRAKKSGTFPPNISVSRSQVGTGASGGVLSKPLSREEKLEILKQKLLEKNRFPWVEGGCFPSNPRRDPNNPDHMEDKDVHKIGHTDWCCCSNCIPLSSGRESICCMEIHEIRPHLKGITCITQHPNFSYLCENKDFAQIHQNMMYGLRPKIPKERDKNRALRKAAYQAFSVWIHGALGKKGERPIPACTVHRVRTAFPDPNYVACCKDYPAEQMIFS